MSLLNSFRQFAQGIDPTVTRLMLGDFEFLEFEVPESIAVRGKQNTVQHQLIGGRRIIDVLGTEYEPFTWSGIITGPRASDRVSALERMRDAGHPLMLTLDEYRFTVVITAFNPVYEYVWRRPYSIELAVVRNEGTPEKVDVLTGALRGLIDSDIGRALGLAKIINVDAVTQTLRKLQHAVSEVKDFAHATVVQVQAVVRPLIAVRNLVQHELAVLEDAAGRITSLGGLVPGNPVSKTISNLLMQADHTTHIPALYSLQDVLSRLNKNVNSGLAANGVRAVTVSGGNLYQVAAQQYGDASLWTSIADANGLDDPQLKGIQTLNIPVSPVGQ